MIGSWLEYVLQSVDHTNGLPLTDRQLEILTLLALGFSEKEVAVRLGISLHTARNHVANLYQRLGLHHRAEAVLMAVRYGLVEVNP
jgi:DNA-binding NarL/FixJ family response regulator